MTLLKLLASLSNPTTRQEAANALAVFLHAKDLIIFIEDPQLKILLPGPGFNYVLHDTISWYDFLNLDNCTIKHGLVPFPDKNNTCSAIGIKASDNTVAVLLGGNPDKEDANFLLEILPLLSQLLKKEQLVITIQSIATTAEKSATKSEKLAVALDTARKSILKSHAQNTELLKTLQLKNEELNRINNDLDNFVYTASHDLRAPVSNMEGLLNLFKEIINGKGIDEAESVLDLMYQSINRFQKTIHDLTEISKSQRFDKDIPKETVSISEVINDIKLLLYNTINVNHASINEDLDIDVIHFSRKNLQSILYNLISNAIKYKSSLRTPVINIKTRQDKDYVIIEVQDNGLGIKGKNLSSLFVMFKRFHDHVEGTGVGLYIVKKMIENTSGKIEVESKENVGSIFRVYLKRHHSPLLLNPIL
jgi:signal transduction histidine kinase